MKSQFQGSAYVLGKPVQAISVSSSQKLAAIACSTELKIVRIEGPTGTTDMCTFSDGPANSIVTDVAWSPNDNAKLALSYAYGSLICLNVAEKASRQSQILSQEWSSGKISTGVNRISWHPSELNTIATANQDGIIRIFDFRSQQTVCRTTSYGIRGYVATKDVAFDPFHFDIFAECSENGTLKVWDRRQIAKPLIVKTKAHVSQILSVSWSPHWEWVLATGSKDKTVKIWDVSALNMDENSCFSGNGFTTCPVDINEEQPVLLNTIHTSAEVARVKWNHNISNCSDSGGGSSSILPSQRQQSLIGKTSTTTTSGSNTNNNNSNKNGNSISSYSNDNVPLLATISTGTGTSSSSGTETLGQIAIWDLVNQNIPFCILKGHAYDACGDFAWLSHSINTLSGGNSSSSVNNSSSSVNIIYDGSVASNNSSSSNNSSNSKNHHRRGNTTSNSNSINNNNTNIVAGSGTSMRNNSNNNNSNNTSNHNVRSQSITTNSINTSNGTNSFNNMIMSSSSSSSSASTTTTTTTATTAYPSFILRCGILSGGRDGRIIMQHDLRPSSGSDSSNSSSNSSSSVSSGCYYPSHHMAPAVTAISSHGHCAFHRGYVPKIFNMSWTNNNNNNNNSSGSSNSSSQSCSPPHYYHYYCCNNNNNYNSDINTANTDAVVVATLSGDYLSYRIALSAYQRNQGIYGGCNSIVSNSSNNGADNDGSDFAISSNGSSKIAVPMGLHQQLRTTTATSGYKPGAAAAAASLEEENNVLLRTGVVHIGLELIDSLADAQRIRLQRGAEARITDPALIALFAKNYRFKMPVAALNAIITTSSSSSNSTTCYTTAATSSKLRSDRKSAAKTITTPWLENALYNYKLALQACQINLSVAKAAGLHCRMSVWATLASLLPMPCAEDEALLKITQLKEQIIAQSAAAVVASNTADTDGDVNISCLPSATPPLRLQLPPSSSLAATTTIDAITTDTSNGSSANISRIVSTTASSSLKQCLPALPFGIELLGTLLAELLEGGDAQHFVVACEILRIGTAHNSALFTSICNVGGLTAVAVRRGYLVYLDLLSKLQLFCEANDIIKLSQDSFISRLSQQGVMIGLKCGSCGKEINKEHYNSSGSSTRSSGWCERCARCVSICYLCHRPVRGLFHWCPVCAHGGHLSCSQKWFQRQQQQRNQLAECPSGCGHHCYSSNMLVLSSQHHSSAVASSSSNSSANHCGSSASLALNNSSQVETTDESLHSNTTSVCKPRGASSSSSTENNYATNIRAQRSLLRQKKIIAISKVSLFHHNFC